MIIASDSDDSDSAGPADVIAISDEEQQSDDFAEVFSPPRVAFAVKSRGLTAHLSLDLKSGFDFLTVAGRGSAFRLFEQHDPFFSMISPPCTLYSQLQVCFKKFQKMNPQVLEKRQKEADAMLEFGAQVGMRQVRRNKFFCFEHPWRASSWRKECMERLASQPGCFTIDFDQCCTGLRCPATLRPIRKRTKLLSNSPAIYDIFQPLQCRCTEPHKQIEGSVDGLRLSEYCQHYPRELCEKIAEAVQLQLSLS